MERNHSSALPFQLPSQAAAESGSIKKEELLDFSDGEIFDDIDSIPKPVPAPKPVSPPEPISQPRRTTSPGLQPTRPSRWDERPEETKLQAALRHAGVTAETLRGLSRRQLPISKRRYHDDAREKGKLSYEEVRQLLEETVSVIRSSFAHDPPQGDALYTVSARGHGAFHIGVYKGSHRADSWLPKPTVKYEVSPIDLPPDSDPDSRAAVGIRAATIADRLFAVNRVGMCH